MFQNQVPAWLSSAKYSWAAITLWDSRWNEMENNLIKCSGNVIWDIMYLLKKSGFEQLYYTGKLSLLINRMCWHSLTERV